LQHTSISPLFTFTRNFILLAMSLTVAIKYPNGAVIVSKWKRLMTFYVVGIAAFIAGITFKIPAFLNQTVSPPKFSYQDQNINNTPFAKYIKTSPDSTYLVFCFSYTCPHCLNSIENMRRYKGTVVDRIVTLAAGPDSSRFSFIQNFKPEFDIKNLPADEMQKLTNLFPAAFYVKHDSIKAVIEGELPSYVVFKNQYNLYSSR